MRLKTKLEWTPALWIKIAISAIVAWFVALPMLLKALLTLMALDILMGVIVASADRKLSSNSMWRGMVKKSGILVLIAATHALEWGTQILISGAVTTFFCLNELLSMVEHAERLGIPIPSVLRERLRQLDEERDRE